ncbi:hypothetical protein [Patulibacter sp. SYSU D01012]|uniref:hypothetical protein n=1 Tax=Patulibacter sp. SYSU D01012 TaxID=2817381 RepID=UPI001B305886|nr:hypothetical protein [Patulibacter sp. SYSU D01012]
MSRPRPRRAAAVSAAALAGAALLPAAASAAGPVVPLDASRLLGVVPAQGAHPALVVGRTADTALHGVRVGADAATVPPAAFTIPPLGEAASDADGPGYGAALPVRVGDRLVAFGTRGDAEDGTLQPVWRTADGDGGGASGLTRARGVRGYAVESAVGGRRDALVVLHRVRRGGIRAEIAVARWTPKGGLGRVRRVSPATGEAYGSSASSVAGEGPVPIVRARDGRALVAYAHAGQRGTGSRDTLRTRAIGRTGAPGRGTATDAGLFGVWDIALDARPDGRVLVAWTQQTVSEGSLSGDAVRARFGRVSGRMDAARRVDRLPAGASNGRTGLLVRHAGSRWAVAWSQLADSRVRVSTGPTGRLGAPQTAIAALPGAEAAAGGLGGLFLDAAGTPTVLGVASARTPAPFVPWRAGAATTPSAGPGALSPDAWVASMLASDTPAGPVVAWAAGGRAAVAVRPDGV